MNNDNLPLGADLSRNAPWNEPEALKCPVCGNRLTLLDPYSDWEELICNECQFYYSNEPYFDDEFI